MASRPSKLPRWADGGSADVVEPSSGKKDVGWASAERPPAQFFNWLLTIIYTWCLYLSDGIIKRLATGTRTPIWSWNDQGDETQLYVDPHGLLMGSACTITNRWGPVLSADSPTNESNVAKSPYFYGESESQCSVNVKSPNAALVPAKSHTAVLELETLNAAVNTTGTCVVKMDTDQQSFGHMQDLVVAMEARVAIEDITSPDVDYRFGFHLQPEKVTPETQIGDATATRYVMFELVSAASPTWDCRVSNFTTAASDVDSTVAPVANAYQTLRVEYHGVNTDLGVANSSATARFFIDGTLAAEIATSDVMNHASLTFTPFFRADVPDATGPTADKHVWCDTMKIAWQSDASPKVPA